MTSLDDIVKAIDAATVHCTRVRHSCREDVAAYDWIEELLASLRARLLAGDVPANYLHDFPIGNILVRRLGPETDKKLASALRRVDDLMLHASRTPEYRQFLRDFEER